MARSRIYPKADAKTQWWETAFTRGTFIGIEKILLHTTETTGWPGYKAGSAAPTFTYHPRQRAWRQHCYLDHSARALVDPAGTLVRENRDNVIQIEIIAYSDEPLGRSVNGLPVSELTDAQLGDLADFIRWVRNEWGGPPLVAPRFLPYPQSAGNSAVRMSGPEYDAFRGILGHQHASGNGHGDPGALNVARILTLAGATTTPVTKPAPVKEYDMPFNLTDKVPGTDVTFQQALVRGVWAYAQVVEGGSIDKRIDAAVGGLGQLRTALAQGNVTDAQAILDRIEVSLTVKPETPPAP